MGIQEQLFYDSAEKAIDNAILQSGKGFKAVAGALWPSLKDDTAYARLKNCLRDDKPEKLTLDEIIFICQFTGRADPLYYMADELSHSRPEPRAAEEIVAGLAGQLQQIFQMASPIMDQIERVQKQIAKGAK